MKSRHPRHRGCAGIIKGTGQNSHSELLFFYCQMAGEKKAVVVVFAVAKSKLSIRISGTLPHVLPSILHHPNAEMFFANRQYESKTKQGIFDPPARLSKSVVCLNSPWKWSCFISEQWTLNMVHAPFSPHQTRLATLDSDLIKVALVVFSSY